MAGVLDRAYTVSPMRRMSQTSRIAPSRTMPAIPRTVAAVPIRLPMAAMSSVPSMTITPTSPGLASSIISTECLVASAGVAPSGGAGRASEVAARPTIALPVTSFMSWRIVPLLPVTSSTASDTEAG